MEKDKSARTMKPHGTVRRERQRAIDRRNEEQNRQKAIGGGQPNELGITQGQNGEQGNTTQPHKVPARREST